MQITLTQLTLENFKGIRNFTLEPGDTCLIRGANAAGKTTIMDGFLWLLFGKDSEGKADFALKTLKDGQEIPNLEHTVEGIFEIDDTTLTLKKVLKEKYTKKRGNSQADFTGHTTDYYIDGVPIQKKEWDQQVSGIIDEETFKLLTSPTYFNSDKFGQSIKPVKPAWERRRELLLEVCGNISDSDVIQSNEDLCGLPTILNHHTIKNHRKIVKSRQTEINKRLDEIPSRIDELDKSLTDVSGYNVEPIQVEIKGLDDQIQVMRDDSVRSNLRKQKSELEAILSELRGDREKVSREARKEIDEKVAALERELRVKRAYITDSWSEIARNEDTVKYNEKEMAELRNDYSMMAKSKADVKDSCPACGQTLPKDQVQDAIKKHNQVLANRLDNINSKGKLLKNKNTRLKEEIEAAIKKVRTDEEEVKVLEGKIVDKIAELNKAPINVPFDTTAIDKIKADLQEINKKLVKNLPPDTGMLEATRSTLQTKIAEVDAAKKTRARIEELGAEEKELAKEYEELERQLSLIGQFTVAKVEMLEEKINNKFELARFKLFEKQINEGIEETCITLYDGVPYGYGLNSGAEINVGLDIVRTLSTHYGIKAPIFIDHAESVTDILDPGTQTIKLMVSEDHPKMEVSNE